MSRPLCQALAAAAIATMSGGLHPAYAGELEYHDVDKGEVLSWLIIGKPELAVREATRMIDGLRPTGDPDTVHLIGEILILRCDALNSLGQFDQARASCTEAIAIFEAAEKDGRPGKWHSEDWHIAQALRLLATTYAATGELENALEARVKELERTTSLAERPNLLASIGDLQQSLGRFRQAEVSYLDAIAARAEVRRDERKMQRDPHTSLANLYLLEERFSRAEQLLTEGIADAEQTQAVLAEHLTKTGLGSENIRANAFNLQALSQRMAWTYFQQGRFEEARQLAREVLAFYEAERWFGFAMIFAMITDVRILLARIEDAEHPGASSAKRYLESAVGNSGSSDLMRAIAQFEFARHHLLTGNDAGAEPYARVATSTLAWLEGEDSPHTARARVILARVFQLQGKYGEALTAAQAAYAAQQAFLPPYHSELGETLSLLAALYDDLDDRDNRKAIEVLLAQHRAARTKFEADR